MQDAAGPNRRQLVCGANEDEVRAARNGGQEVAFNTDRIVLDEISVLGGRGSPNCYPRAIQLMADGHIDTKKMLTHTYPLDEFTEALRVVQAREDGVMRAMITP